MRKEWSSGCCNGETVLVREAQVHSSICDPSNSSQNPHSKVLIILDASFSKIPPNNKDNEVNMSLMLENNTLTSKPTKDLSGRRRKKMRKR